MNAMTFLFLNQLEIVSAVFCLGLVILAYIDLKTMILPNYLTMPLILLGILYNHFSSYPLTSSLGSLSGALIGYWLIWLINKVYFLIMGQAGIGMGDAKLLSGIGALLGSVQIISILIIACLLGILGGLIWLRINRLSKDQAFPFGPYLSTSGIVHILDSRLNIGIVQYLAL